MKEMNEFSKQVRKAYEKALKRYSKREYVTAVDVGTKYTGGKETDVEAVRIHVKEKKSGIALESAEIFPESIDGVPVDVIEAVYAAKDYSVGVESISDRRSRFQVLQPGISVAHYSVTAGTLGLLVNDSESGKPAILSNWHVLCGSNNARIGDPILQPGSKDGGRTSNDTIAYLERWMLDKNGDAAIALLNSIREWRSEQLGTNVTLTGLRIPQKGDILVKSGRSTGVTYGRVDGKGRYKIEYAIGEVEIDGFRLVPRKQGNPDNEEISSGGDSGSCWYDPSTNEGVGLHFAGETNSSPQEEKAIACFLTRVFDRLKVNLI